MDIQRNKHNVRLWVTEKFTLSVGYFPMWRRGGLAIMDNGGRHENECLDINWYVWKLHGNVTVWGMRKLSRLLKHIPNGKSGRGFKLGIFPLGSAPDEEAADALD